MNPMMLQLCAFLFRVGILSFSAGVVVGLAAEFLV